MLHIHRAERSDRLVAALGDVLITPLADPLASEVVAVHSRGIERWIAQELSTRLGAGGLGTDGVCANVEFPFPGRLVRGVVATASGIDPDVDPWLPDRSTWPLLRIVDQHRDHPMLGPLRAHVDPARDGGASRRLGAVRHIADLFDRYGVHRPEMILRWLAEDDVGPDGDPLLDRHRWQPVLWRALRAAVDTPSFPERQETALSAIRDNKNALDLPDRLALFGLTALPATYLEVLEAVARHRDVHLMLLHPSDALWQRLADTVADSSQQLWPRERDPTGDLPRNPLLRSWGRDARELQLLAPLPPDPRHRRHHPLDASQPRTLLQRIQADVRADRHPSADGGDRPTLDPGDRSVQVHDCHGRLRQVEVLREAILHLLAEDPSLEPRDVIVMCPDIEGFASLITAVFGADAALDDHTERAEGAPPPLRVRLADRSLRRTNPVLEVVASLIELVGGRATASSVLDLLASEPVRRRFAIDDDDLEQLERWITETQIRWGFDADHRRQQGLPALHANTWQAGLERLQLGVAMADESERLVAGVAPYDGVEGRETDLAGRLVEFVARLRHALEAMGGPHDIVGWREVVSEAADALTATTEATAWQRLQLDGVLADLVDDATAGDDATQVQLTIDELETLLGERLGGRPSRTSHRTGDLTFCTLVPMRSVPHRVVCLLGLDDGAFPRQAVPDADDLLLLAPRIGDRDPRSEDRQLLLDAVLAAADTLLITYAGRDVRTNEDRPPSVPIDELLDLVDRTVTTPDGSPAREHLTVRHPLAAHDPSNFEPGRILAGRPWGFQPGELRAAEARRDPAATTREFLTKELPLPDEDVIDLDDLIAFLEHPIKAFCRQRLDVRFLTSQDQPSDRIPATLRGLDAWKVGDPLLRAWRTGQDLERVEEVLRAKGLLPPGALGSDDLADVREQVHRIIDLAGKRGVDPAVAYRTVDVRIELPDGRLLDGVVPDVALDSEKWTLESLSYSRVKPKARLAMWARFLAVNLEQPGRPWTAITLGRHERRSPKARAVELPRLTGSPTDIRATATRHLLRLVDLYDRGRRSPIPVYCETSHKIADNVRGDRPATAYVGKDAWTSTRYPKEDLDPYHVAVLGGQVHCDELFVEPARPDEADWSDDGRRAVAYAVRLWGPILDLERRCER